MKTHLYTALMLLGFVLLTACGSGGGSGDPAAPTTATGVFKDATTAGLSYTSGSQSGVTNARGQFTYEVDKPVTFKIGAITVGTAASGSAVISPIDLVSGGTSINAQVLNIVKVLTALDSDGDTSNGITISQDIQTAAAGWTAIDISASTTIASDISAIVADADTAAPIETHTLLSDAAAQSHIEATLLCSYAGGYIGTYSGDATGDYGFLIDALTGKMQGVGYENVDGTSTRFDITGTNALSYDQISSFGGSTSTGSIFTGKFTSVNSHTGTWSNAFYGVSGTFSGSRIGGATDAVYRFTGNYIGAAYGLFTIDVNASNQVTGNAYNIVDDELVTVTGSVSGTDLTVTVSDGTTATGTLDRATGALSGGWTATDGATGTFSGSGCKLN